MGPAKISFNATCREECPFMDLYLHVGSYRAFLICKIPVFLAYITANLHLNFISMHASSSGWGFIPKLRYGSLTLSDSAMLIFATFAVLSSPDTI